MKRFISFATFGIIAFLCVMICALSSVQVSTVSEDAMVAYGSCETHVYGEYKTIGEATCTKTATKYRTCAVCGDIDSVEIPMDPDNHSNVSDLLTYDPKPTCISGGVQYKICYGCNKPAEVINLEADPNAHAPNGDYVVITKETCLTAGEKAYKCTYCNEYYGNEEIPVNSEKHVVSESSTWHVIQLPSCAEKGVMVAYCDLCGTEAERRSVPATNEHTPAAKWTIDTEANCSAEGVMSRHCTVCDAPCEETVIPATPDKHTFSDEFTTDKEANCISKGSMSKHCLYCDEKTDVYPIDINPDGHSYSNEWIVTKKPSCSSEGLKHRVCTLCKKNSVPTMIAKTAHTYPVTYEVIKESADKLSAQVKYICKECGYEYVTILVFGTNNGIGDMGDGSIPGSVFGIIPVDNTVIKVDYENFIISNVARNMLIDEFMANFKNGYVFVVYNEKGEFKDEDEYIGTGCRLNFETIDGNITNYYVSVTGDIDSDGKVTAADARLVLRAAAKMDELTGAYYTAADVNLDGKVTAADARKTLRVAANIEFFENTYEH